MSRKQRIDVVEPGVPNHVVLRGNNRRNLFSYSFDRAQFVRYLGEAMASTGSTLQGAALLTNHVHLLITPPSVDALSALVQACAQRYAGFRNRTTNGSGKLFEQRFHSSAVTDDDYLAVVTAYIDLNAELGGVPRRHLGWTTMGLHLGMSAGSRIPASLWTPSAWYLGLSPDGEERQRLYAQWLEVGRRRAAEAREAASDTRDTVARQRRPDGTRAR